MKQNILIAVVIVLAAAAAAWYVTGRSSETVDTSTTPSPSISTSTSPSPRITPRASASSSPSAGTKVYVGNSPEECMRIRFVCEPGSEYFADDKGCGCVSVNQ